MTLQTLGLILLSVTISALAQVCLKLGMSSPAVQQAMSSSSGDTFYTVSSNPAVLGGLMLYGFGAVIWLFVLARVNVTIAYPFVSISFLISAVLAVVFLGEPLSRPVLIGTALIAMGILVLARG